MLALIRSSADGADMDPFDLSSLRARVNRTVRTRELKDTLVSVVVAFFHSFPSVTLPFFF